MKASKVLITGAAGFIGSHLGDYLTRQGHQVIGLDNFMHPAITQDQVDFKLVYGDVRYYEDIDTYVKDCDIVYHLAAQINVDKSIAHPQETMDINFHGTENILNACRRHQKKMVFASTSEVYGGHSGRISEDSQTYAQSPYAVSKLAADKLCGNYHDLYGLEVYRVRCFNTFGPRQSHDTYGAVIPIFVHKILNNESPVIFGDGLQKRDYIYVDDVVRAYEMIPTKPELAGVPINVGTGKSIEIYRIVGLINHMLHKSVLFTTGKARPGEVKKLEANIDFISKNYGFKPLFSFEEGLRSYLEWLKQSK